MESWEVKLPLHLDIPLAPFKGGIAASEVWNYLFTAYISLFLFASGSETLYI
jgi:hypothetical protein